jgi:hypothetical protein
MMKLKKAAPRGHDRQKDHGCGVHREQRVVGLRAHQRVVRSPELEPDNQCFEAAQDEKHTG